MHYILRDRIYTDPGLNQKVLTRISSNEDSAGKITERIFNLQIASAPCRVYMRRRTQLLEHSIRLAYLVKLLSSKCSMIWF